MKYFFSLCMFLIVSFSFSQKKELRSAKKLFSNSQYEEVEKFLLDNQNLFSESDSKLIGQFNFLLAQTYRNLKKFKDAFDRLSLVKNTSSLSKDYSVEVELLKADCVNAAIVDSNEKNFKDSVDKLYIAYLLDVEKNIDYLYFAASNSVNGNDYKKALEYYLILKEKKYTGIITEYFITEVASGDEIAVSKEEMEILSKTPEYENPRSNDTPSRFPEIVKNIALIYNQLGDREKAIAAINDARSENPEDVDLIITEANYYIESGDKEKFKNLINQAIEKDPSNGNLYYNLGVVSAELGEKDNAIEFYNKAIELEPKFESSYLNLVALILEEDVRIRDEMDKLGTSRADDLKYDKLKLERENIFKECIPILKSLIEINKNNEEAIRTLINIYAVIEEYDEVRKLKELLN